MLSKKNAKLMIQKQQPRKQRFGIRKLSIGVVSVLLGLLFIGGGHSASADDQVGTDATVVTGTVSSAPASAQPVASAVLPTSAEAASVSSADTVADTNVTTSSAANSVVADTPSLSAPVTSQVVSSQQPATPVTSDAVVGSDPVASDQPVDSVVPDSQVPVVSDTPTIDSGSGESTAPGEGLPGTGDTGEVVTPPAIDQPGETEAPKDGVQTVDKIHTDQILKDKYGIDVNHLDAKSVLLLASLFHIFANEANLGADVNGNIAVGILNSNVDFGTRGDSINLTKGDIYYIQQLNTGLQSGSFRNELFNHVIFGKDVNVEIINGQVYVNGNHMVNLKPEEVFKDGAGTNYIDFPALFQRLLNAAGFYASQEESAGVIKDFSDMNDRFIDVSNAVPKDNVIYVNIPFEYLNAPQPIKIYGLSSKVNGPTVVINVIGMPAGSEVSIHTQVKLYYDDEKNNHVNPGESHAHPNHILWNFGDSAAHIVIQSGHFMGSILAPNATITANVNVDGNIIANIVNIKGGESHKWDIHPVEEFVQPTDPQPTDPQPTDPQPTDPQPTDPQPTDPQPTDPQPTDPQPTDPQPTDPQPTDPQPTDPQPTDPQPTDPQPTDPQPTDPQPTDPQPTDPQPTDPQPTDPQPTDPQPTDPQPTDPQPTDPQPTDPQPTDPQPTDPQPEPTPDKDPVLSTPESATPAKPDGSHQSQPVQLTSQDSVVVDTPSSQFQTVAAPASAIAKAEDEAVALPQTGTDNHGILLGIALAITAQLMIWGLVQPKKKKK
ncbi:MAG: choice-of-anchor A family protein [Lactobacillaceae bacterium]|nr:choice-of-anchor A family protein [Lactobacillaceae bacterium]